MLEKYSLHLRSLALPLEGLPERFPFTLPVIRSLDRLELRAPVTFFIGENGSGKSTLLEALAIAAGSITVGSESAVQDDSLLAVRELARRLKLVWSRRTRKGFFMRAEDFFGYVRRLEAERAALQQDLERVEQEYQHRSPTARGFARLPYANELGALGRDYGEGLDARSHGESYLQLFQRRFVPGGLYLLDEPEAPLSAVRQLSLLAMLHQMQSQQAQFIIATHSPILMAYPGAVILSFDGGRVAEMDYEEVEHVRLTRDFLNNRQSYLRRLLED